jgi:Mg2+ and Co2+ transporter CorA
LLETISSAFGIHPLEMEDVTKLYQRPKFEEHQSHLFIIARLLAEVKKVYYKTTSYQFFVETILLSPCKQTMTLFLK